jgi:hypothetical protein
MSFGLLQPKVLACVALASASACAGGTPPTNERAEVATSGGAGGMHAGAGATLPAGPIAAAPMQHEVARAKPPGDLPPGACVSTGTIEASLRPANLLFAIDRSASMNCNLPPATSSAQCESKPEKADPALPAKWEIVRDALKAALAALPAGTSAGITYFNNDDMCGVQSKPHVAIRPLDAAQLASLGASLDAVKPVGGTPIVGGLILAYKQLNPDQTPDLHYGNRFVVLLTDGQEGCAPEATEHLLNVELPKARVAAITTFVIGVPGSEISRGFLSRLAFAGGTPSAPDCHFDMTADGVLSAALSGALAAISGRALSCEFDVPQPRNGGALDYDKVNVEYVERPGEGAKLIAQDPARACDQGADGWQYSADKAKIVLCGSACASVRRAASIRIALGCKSVTVL